MDSTRARDYPHLGSGRSFPPGARVGQRVCLNLGGRGGKIKGQPSLWWICLGLSQALAWAGPVARPGSGRCQVHPDKLTAACVASQPTSSDTGCPFGSC